MAWASIRRCCQKRPLRDQASTLLLPCHVLFADQDYFDADVNIASIMTQSSRIYVHEDSIWSDNIWHHKAALVFVPTPEVGSRLNRGRQCSWRWVHRRRHEEQSGQHDGANLHISFVLSG